MNRLVGITDPIGSVTKFEYDGNGNRTKVVLQDGTALTSEYDALNQKTCETFPDGRSFRYEYDSSGHVTCAHSAAGTAHYHYDAAGQQTKITDEWGREFHLSYNALGQISEITEPDGRKIIHEYASGGRLKKSILRDGSSISYEYDDSGNVIKQIANDGFTVEFAYDCLNRVTKVWDSTGNTKEFELDAAGNATKTTDALGNTYRYKYSPNGNLLETLDPLGNGTFCEYDEMGNLVSASQCSAADIAEAVKDGINPAGIARTVAAYERNLFGQVTSYTDALGNTEHYNYDRNGRLMSKTDREGYRTDFVYDLSGNLTEIQYADGKTVKRDYDERNRLTRLEDWQGVMKFEYGKRSRMPSVVTDFEGRRISYKWNGDELLESLTYPDGSISQYRYDRNGKITEIQDGSNSVSYTYDEAGRLMEKAYSNGTHTQYAYNEQGRLQRLSNVDSNHQSDSYRYEYDVLGNRTAVHKDRREAPVDSGSFHYEYDALSRLTGVKKDHQYIRQYEYDGFGNRTALKENGNVVQYTYNEENQLILETSGDTRREFEYDKRGNRVLELVNGEKYRTYRYNSLNRLDTAELGNESIRYGYNGFLQQINQTKRHKQHSFADEAIPDSRTSFLLDPLREHHNLLMKETDSVRESQRYVWDWQHDIPAIGLHHSEKYDNTAFMLVHPDAQNILHSIFINTQNHIGCLCYITMVFLDLVMNGIHEYKRIDCFKRPVLPCCHIWHDFVADFAD